MAPAALGSDTGGSIRQPASFCGVVGLKPTYGRVSRYGLVAFASSLDQIGPIARDVRDAARLLGVIAGHDPRDGTSLDAPAPNYEAALDDGGRLDGLRLGWPREYFGVGLDPDVERAVRRAADRLAGLGAELIEVELPHTPYAVATYYLIATAEASANLARFDGVRYGRRVDGGDPIEMYLRTRSAGFGPEVKRRLILGAFALSSGYYDAYYLRAQKVRTLIRRDFEAAFTRCDALIGPASPTPAYRLGEKLDDPLAMYLEDILTIPVNLAGIGALAVPCGYTHDGLPVGLQIIPPALEEARALRIGHALEQAQGPTRMPPIAAEGGKDP
jgi:aspartyl-tRNA(Asn)/glutamyl-tRNA(Gln) amidotransferase subunit A